MRTPRLMALVTSLVTAATLFLPSHSRAQTRPSPASALRIVVLEGEDAVNIIQQRTAVAPVVEVRDRNDQPVSGAVVSFAIRGGRATFNGARTLSVATNAAGRAVGAGLTPTGSGALQISATASFQGQTAAVTIAQTNVMTAAQAAAAGGSSAGGAGGSAAGATGGAAAAGAGGGAATGGAAGAGAAAGAGSGISLATIGIVGAAVAGGTLVATQALAPGSGTTYNGPFSGVLTNFTRDRSCSRDEQHSGTIVMRLDTSSGSVSGKADMSATYSTLAVTPGCGPGAAPGTYSNDEMPVSGTPSNLTFNVSRPGNPGVTITFSFAGSLSGDQIVGTYSEDWIQQPIGFGGSQRFPVTLTKE